MITRGPTSDGRRNGNGLVKRSDAVVSGFLMITSFCETLEGGALSPLFLRYRAELLARRVFMMGKRPALLIQADHTGAGGEAYAKANHHCRASPLGLFRQHEARGSAGKIAVVLQNFIRAMHLHGIFLDMEL